MTPNLSTLYTFTESDPADSWDVEDEPVITPDDDDAEEIDDVEGDATPKVSKKKIPKVEESRSKKEHVNVVFIGHVGKLHPPEKNSLNFLSNLFEIDSI